MKCYTLQGHPYPDDPPIPGEREVPISGPAKLIALVVILAMVAAFFHSKKHED